MTMTQKISYSLYGAFIAIGLMLFATPVQALEDPYTTTHSSVYTTTQNINTTVPCVWEKALRICYRASNNAYWAVDTPSALAKGPDATVCEIDAGPAWTATGAFWLENSCTGAGICGNSSNPRPGDTDGSTTIVTTETMCHYIDQVDSWSACVGNVQTAVNVQWTTTSGNSCSHVPLVRGCTSPPDPNLAPVGTHTAANCSVIRGWTCDANDYSGSLTVEFYDGVRGGGGNLLGTVVADRTEGAAVGANCGGNPNHGFRYVTPSSWKDGFARDIYAYALNDGPGADTLLNNSPRTLQCGTPPECSDLLDNDGDGIIDFSNGDPGCTSAADDDETDPVPPPTPSTATLTVSRDGGTGSWTAPSGGNITNLGSAEELRLYWDSTGATSCTKTFRAGPAVSGSQNNVTEPFAGQTSNYIVSCTGPGGNSSDSLTVFRPSTEPTIIADDQSVHVGDTVNISWDTNGNDPSSCTLTETTESGLDDTYTTALPGLSGVETLTVGERNEYTITCLGGSASVNIYALPVIFEI